MSRHRLAAVLVLLSACPWRSDSDVMRVHLEVLGGLADKAASNAAAGRRPTSNDVTELTYPLQRARQFARQHEDDAGRESHRLFVATLDRYRVFVDSIDAARGDAARWEQARPAVGAAYRVFQEAAAQARAALDREDGR